MIPKFRAWLKDEQEMQDVLAFDTRGHSFLGIEGAHVTVDGWCDIFEIGKQAELMQSTGLKDKNGVEIFEGDVVLLSVNDGFDHLVNEKAIVQSSECHSGLICKLVDLDLEYRIYYDPVFHTDYEVIGNIYENSELVEGQQ